MQSKCRNASLVGLTGIGVSIAGIAGLAIMAIATVDVGATMFSLPLPGAVELIAMLMVVVIFLALPDVEIRRQHISVDLVYQRFPPGARLAANVLNDLLSVLFFGAMAWQGWKLFWESWLIREYASGFIAFPVYPTKALFALGVTATSIMAVINLMRSLRLLSAER